MRLVICFILLVGAFHSSHGQRAVDQSTTKTYAKEVSKLAKTLTQKTLETSLIVGYKKYEATEATSFYNMASESIFYIVLCKDSSTIHYQIPLQSMGPCSREGASAPQAEWCVDMAMQKPAYMVIYNKAGAMVYNQTFTKLTIPVGSVAVVKKLEKHSLRLVQLRQQ